jgi:hypothetical protein
MVPEFQTLSTRNSLVYPAPPYRRDEEGRPYEEAGALHGGGVQRQRQNAGGYGPAKHGKKHQAGGIELKKRKFSKT